MKSIGKTGKSGFTLIELLIVIAIIGILAAIAIPNFLNMRAKGQVAACASSLGGIKTAQEMFMTDWDVYAASLQNLNNYSPAGQNRVYIDQAKVDANCNTPLTSTTATGWYANAVPKGKFGGAGFVCNLRYWESGNDTTGKCG